MQAKWALILGASSGFGAATAKKLSEDGYNIFGVHLDRQATMPNVEKIINQIENVGQKAVFFNVNAADHNAMESVLGEVEKILSDDGSKVNLLLHSLAFGTLKRFIAENPSDRVSKKQMEMTLDVMAHTLVYWTQALVSKNLFAEGGRIFAMTSAGSVTVFPTYGVVSAAKSALESHIRQLAVELAPKGITANAIMAGVTETPALKKIPGNDVMIDFAKAKNPSGRLTTPEDVANAIAALARPEAYWITGNVIAVDGGELISTYGASDIK